MRSLGAQILQVDIDVNCECTSIRDLLSWAFRFVGFAELSDAQIKVNWLSYAVIYLFFLSSAAAEVVFALSWTHKLENIVIHSHSIEPSERGP